MIRNAGVTLTLCLVAVAAGWFLPAPVSLEPPNARLSRLAVVLVAVCAAAAVARWRLRRHVTLWAGAALGMLGLAAAVYLLADNLEDRWTATYNGKRVIIGRELTKTARQYLLKNPSCDSDCLLLDAAGDTRAVWTQSSIALNRVLLAALALATAPLFSLATLFGAHSMVCLLEKSTVAAPSPRPRPPGVAVGAQRDFFLSYNQADRDWAVRIASWLEEAGFTVFVQAWDFEPGSNFVLEMHRSLSQSRRVLFILSEDYLNATFTQPEWAAAFALDPTGSERRLVPVRVRPCELTGLLATLVYIDLTGRSEGEARQVLLDGLRKWDHPDRPAPRSASAGA